MYRNSPSSTGRGMSLIGYGNNSKDNPINTWEIIPVSLVSLTYTTLKNNNNYVVNSLNCQNIHPHNTTLKNNYYV